MTAKKRRTAPKSAPTAQGQGQSLKLKEQPSLEWLAEMAIRLREDRDPDMHTGIKMVDDGWVDAVRKAQDAFNAAAYVQRYDERERGKEQEIKDLEAKLRAEVNAETLKTGKMEFNEACKWITGEKRRDRAVDKFFKLMAYLYYICFWLDEVNCTAHRPPPYRTTGYVPLSDAATFRREFKVFSTLSKKELARIFDTAGYEPDSAP